ncbi:MAG: MraY family glycosyltransferase [Candidatus Staskawiczbacteria bacterium]|nr:MraY family glycosyltransferase [Candidatus Staskawiczbacteria bacterium]
MIVTIQLYFFIFFIAAILSAVFLTFAKKISDRYNFYDNPENDSLKRHKKPISFFGGAAILTSFLSGLISIWILNKNINFNFEYTKIAALFIGGIIAWFYGFWDDTYWQKREKISQEAKIFLQIPIAFILALIFYIAQIKYQFFGISLFGIALATILFIFIENAVNLQDGLDGLASGIVLISSIAFFIFFIFSHNIFAAFVSVAIMGAVFSFLVYNWNPASIFMGNNGSYFLGFLMTALAIMASYPGRFFYSLLPYLFLGAPIINVFYVFTKRWANGKSFFSADRNHIHDELYKITKSVPKSVIIIYFIHLILVIVGLTLLICFNRVV